MIKDIRILIVEDDIIISKKLKNLLEKRFQNMCVNIVIDQAISFKRGKSLLLRHRYKVFSLDVILPDGNGLDLIPLIRTSVLNKDSKILILTTKEDAKTRINTFEFGADGYLSKPFLSQEYVLRIKRLLNYKKQIIGNFIQLATNVRLNILNNFIVVFGNKVKLTKQETALLEILSRNYVTTKEYIIDSLEEKSSVKSLRMLISRLRNKLKNQTGYTLIKTEVGVGYSLYEF